MNKRCRGIACIINVFRVDCHKKPRNGTQVDCERLTQLFEQYSATSNKMIFVPM